MKIKNIFSYWRKSSYIQKYNPVKIVNFMGDIPNGKLGKDVYLINRGDKYRWVVFDCPNGHKKRIEINLMKNSSPSWEIVLKRKRITLYPSIDVNDSDCNCHFWLKKNKAFYAFYS